jgi:hypothetical protein
VNTLKLKFLYVCRFQFRNNFLWEEWHDQITKDIVARLEAQGAKKDSEMEFEIPHFNYNEIEPLDFYNRFTRPGRPAILHGVPMKAMNWTPEYLADRAGDWKTAIRCGPINQNMTVREYVDSAKDPDANRCYLDNNANIFEEFPDLEEELELWRFAPYAMGEMAEEGKRPKGLFFGNLFLGVFPELGVTWHCANYNNLFFMIHGRKTWSFIDPSNTFMVYPTFRPMGRDAISRITYMAAHEPELTNKYFPLFRYAPKYKYTLSKGDMLINPPWNWHLVDNIDDETVAVATRWSDSNLYPYTNALFAFNHFTSRTFWTFAYQKISHKLGARQYAPYNPTAHIQFDESVNFDHYGTMWHYRDIYQNLVTPDIWTKYTNWLKQKGEQHGQDYFAHPLI